MVDILRLCKILQPRLMQIVNLWIRVVLL